MTKNILKGFAALLAIFTSAACTQAKAKETPESSSTENQTQKIETDMSTQQPADTNSVKVKVETSVGDFTVLLYGDTPAHRDNFVKLVNEGFYNGTLFHRVIKEFMAQAGDPDSKTAQPGQHLGSGGPGYTLPAEINFPKHFHKRGALAAARQGDQVNPERRSSGSQFYVVTGKRFINGQLDAMENQLKNQQMQGIFNRLAMQYMDSIRQMQASGDAAGLEALRQKLIGETESEAAKNPASFTPEMREAYTKTGGAPHLDGQYTVFGEVIDGMDVIDKIEAAETDNADRPTEDIVIKNMEIVK